MCLLACDWTWDTVLDDVLGLSRMVKSVPSSAYAPRSSDSEEEEYLDIYAVCVVCGCIYGWLYPLI